VGHHLLFTTRTPAAIPFLLTGATVTVRSLETVKQGPLLSWKIETWLPNCGVIHYGKVDHLSRLPVFFPLTFDVQCPYNHILPQRLPGWKTGMRKVSNIRMNWPIVMSYNLLHEQGGIGQGNVSWSLDLASPSLKFG